MANLILPSFRPNHFVEVDAWFEYVKGYDYVDDLGLRIKRTSDFINNNSEPSNIKRYYYKKAEKINTPEETPFEVFNVPKYLRFQKAYKVTVSEGQGFQGTSSHIAPYYVSILSSNSLQELLPGSDSNSLYTNVTVSYGGDNFEKGGIEKEFKMFHPFDIVKYHTSPVGYQVEHIGLKNHSNQNINNGLLTSTSYYNKGETLKKVKKRRIFISYWCL